MPKAKVTPAQGPGTRPDAEVIILAGGRSSRMGQDKTQLRLNGRTLLNHIAQSVQPLQLPLRVIRRDLIPGRGPLGGIHKALKTSQAQLCLFLSCDMPFIPERHCSRLLKSLRISDLALFTVDQNRAGFPFALRRQALPLVEHQLSQRLLSLQALAENLKARSLLIRQSDRHLFLNINTPRDWQEAQILWASIDRGNFSPKRPA